jgi:Holliday junction resolvasome RuvABC endonuclease subunit
MRLLGIDLGIRKIAITCLDDDVLVWADAHSTPEDMSRDLQLRDLGMFAQEISTLHAAEAVWIEDTIIGNNRKYSIGLAQTMGAVLAALAQSRLAQGTDVRLVDNKTWKKDVCGNGNATKDVVRDYIHVTHPAYAPLCGDDQDLYDAACVGLYGLQLTARAADLRLSAG